jgi:hypothetical protein
MNKQFNFIFSEKNPNTQRNKDNSAQVKLLNRESRFNCSKTMNTRIIFLKIPLLTPPVPSRVKNELKLARRSRIQNGSLCQSQQRGAKPALYFFLIDINYAQALFSSC